MSNEHDPRVRDKLAKPPAWLSAIVDEANHAFLRIQHPTAADTIWVATRLALIWFDRRLRAIEERLDLDAGEP